MKLRMIFAALLAVAPVAQAAPQLSFTDTDMLFRRDTKRPADTSRRDTTLTLWRGERGSVAAMFTPAANTGRLDVRLESADGTPLPDGISARFIDYVLTDSWQACGYPPDSLAPFEVADALVRSTSAECVAGAQRPVWVTIDVPHTMAEGSIAGRLIVRDRYASRDLDTLNIAVNIIGRTLPLPGQQQFYINFWQQPYAISRYYGVEPWSDEHFEHLRPYAQMLARAGQKAVSTILFYEPWGQQSNDKFEPMVETILGKDGTWRYDYTVFDRYVEFMAENGINGEIDCFSMIPWDMSFRYFDEASDSCRTISCRTSDKDYADLWRPFLIAFRSHLIEKGWLDRAMIAIDERALPDMQNAIALLDEVAPDIKVALAGNYHPEIADRFAIYTLTMGDPFPEGVIDKRRSEGKRSLYYTCCSSPEPNIFTNNNPADAAFIPVFCHVNNADGYLHWAFTNWTDNPMHDTRFFMFAPGDTYCVYPDGGSSVRWERFIEGVQMVEKIRAISETLLEKGDTQGFARLSAALAPLRGTTPSPAAERLRQYDNLRNVIASLQ